MYLYGKWRYEYVLETISFLWDIISIQACLTPLLCSVFEGTTDKAESTPRCNTEKDRVRVNHRTAGIYM